jgi:hypothetical protein
MTDELMSMENCDNYNDGGKAEALVETPDQFILCPLQIPDGLAWNETQASAAKDLSYGTACVFLIKNRNYVQLTAFYKHDTFTKNSKS